jgi:hypothetical protein
MVAYLLRRAPDTSGLRRSCLLASLLIEDEAFCPTELTFPKPTRYVQWHVNNFHVPVVVGKENYHPRVLIRYRIGIHVRVAPEGSVQDERAAHARGKYRRLEAHVLRAMADVRKRVLMPVTNSQELRISPELTRRGTNVHDSDGDKGVARAEIRIRKRPNQICTYARSNRTLRRTESRLTGSEGDQDECSEEQGKGQTEMDVTAESIVSHAFVLVRSTKRRIPIVHSLGCRDTLDFRGCPDSRFRCGIQDL